MKHDYVDRLLIWHGKRTFVKDKFGSNDNLQHGHKTMYLVIHSLYSQMFVFRIFIHKKNWIYKIGIISYSLRLNYIIRHTVPLSGTAEFRFFQWHLTMLHYVHAIQKTFIHWSRSSTERVDAESFLTMHYKLLLIKYEIYDKNISNKVFLMTQLSGQILWCQNLWNLSHPDTSFLSIIGQ